MIPSRRRAQSQSRSSVNELNQNQHSGPSSTSFCDNSRHDSNNFTVPKQIVDIVDLANTGNNSN